MPEAFIRPVILPMAGNSVRLASIRTLVVLLNLQIGHLTSRHIALPSRS